MQHRRQGPAGRGLDSAAAVWDDAAADVRLGADMDRYVIHQVSQRAHRGDLRTAGDRPERGCRCTFPTFGNIGPASVPFTLADESTTCSAGDRVLLHGHRLRPERRLLEIVW